MHHCPQCHYDMCLKCYEVYGESRHVHRMKKLPFEKVKQLHPGSYENNNVYCSGQEDKRKCPKPNFMITDPNDKLYWDYSIGFILCNDCGNELKK